MSPKPPVVPGAHIAQHAAEPKGLAPWRPCPVGSWHAQAAPTGALLRLPQLSWLQHPCLNQTWSLRDSLSCGVSAVYSEARAGWEHGGACPVTSKSVRVW